MDATTGRCVYCGTERPLDEARCPTCGREWADERVVEPPIEPEPTPGRVVADMTTTTDTGTTSVGQAIIVGDDGEPEDIDDKPAPDDPETTVALDVEDALEDVEETEKVEDIEQTEEAQDAEETEDVQEAEGTEKIEGPAAENTAPVEGTDAVEGTDVVEKIDDAEETEGAGEADDVAADGGASDDGDIYGDAETVVATAAPPPSRQRAPAASRQTGPSSDTGDESTKPVRWWIPVGIAALVLAVYAVIFAILLTRTGDDTTALVTTTAPPATTTTTAPTTTIPETTTTVSTEPPTTTSTLPPIPASGDAIPLGDLALGAFELGPLEFGDPDSDALGILVSTFGQPDTYFDVGENFGLCPTDSGRAVVWGPFTAITRMEGGAELLAGFRLEASDSNADHPAADLVTFSGLGLGDDTEALEDTYRSVSYREIEGSPGYIVARSSDRRTLLWGALGSGDPAAVTAISSPRPCDGGPFPS